MSYKSPVHVTACLRVWGDEVIPAEIARILGAEPTMSYRKGDVHVGKVTGRAHTRATGVWIRKSQLARVVPLEQHFSTLLAQVTSDLSIWDQLHAHYKIDVFCGLFIDTHSMNQVLDLSPQMLRMLADRHVALILDCYGRGDRSTDAE